MKQLDFYTSDLHCGITNLKCVERMFANAFKKAELLEGTIRRVVICGDLGESIQLVNRLMCAVRQYIGDQPELVITVGNHCLNPFYDGMDFKEKYEEAFGLICSDVNAIFLDQAEPIIRDGVALIGNTGWYDFEALNGEHDLPPFSGNRLSAVYWDNKLAPNFYPDSHVFQIRGTSNVEFARQCRSRIVSQLEALEKDDSVQDVIVATHTPVLYKEIKDYVGKEYDPRYDPFFYHPSMGTAIKQFPKAKMVISGHIHEYAKIEVFREELQPLFVYTINSHYHYPKGLLFNAGDYKESWLVLHEKLL